MGDVNFMAHFCLFFFFFFFFFLCLRRFQQNGVLRCTAVRLQRLRARKGESNRGRNKLRDRSKMIQNRTCRREAPRRGAKSKRRAKPISKGIFHSCRCQGSESKQGLLNLLRCRHCGGFFGSALFSAGFALVLRGLLLFLLLLLLTSP